MNSLSRTLAAAGALLISGSAVGAVMEGTAAMVNGNPIMLSEYQKEVSTALEYWKRTEPEALGDPANIKKLRESTLEELINREVLYDEGTKKKIKVRERDIDNGLQEIKDRFKRDETGKELSESESEQLFQKQLKSDGLTYEQFRQRMSKQIMARKLIDEEVKSRVTPPDESEIKAYFKKIADFNASASTAALKAMSDEEALAFRQISAQVKAASSERVRVSRILVKISPNASDNERKRALKTANEIRKKLADGSTPFADVARAESEDPESAARGGDIGYVLRNVSPPNFEKVAFSLPVGDISEPILTEIGYNIIRVQEKRAAEAPEFERFKEELGKAMMNMRFQKDLEAYIKGLKDKATIERSTSALE